MEAKQHTAREGSLARIMRRDPEIDGGRFPMKARGRPKKCRSRRASRIYPYADGHECSRQFFELSPQAAAQTWTEVKHGPMFRTIDGRQKLPRSSFGRVRIQPCTRRGSIVLPPARDDSRRWSQPRSAVPCDLTRRGGRLETRRQPGRRQRPHDADWL